MANICFFKKSHRLEDFEQLCPESFSRVAELRDIKTSTVQGVYDGEKLGSIVEDSEIAKDLSEMQTFNQADILSRIIDKYEHKYFGMEQNDWRRIIRSYFIPHKGVVYDFKRQEGNDEMSIAAENSPRENN